MGEWGLGLGLGFGWVEVGWIEGLKGKAEKVADNCLLTVMF